MPGRPGFGDCLENVCSLCHQLRPAGCRRVFGEQGCRELHAGVVGSLLVENVRDVVERDVVLELELGETSEGVDAAGQGVVGLDLLVSQPDDDLARLEDRSVPLPKAGGPRVVPPLVSPGPLLSALPATRAGICVRARHPRRHLPQDASTLVGTWIRQERGHQSRVYCCTRDGKH